MAASVNLRPVVITRLGKRQSTQSARGVVVALLEGWYCAAAALPQGCRAGSVLLKHFLARAFRTWVEG